MHGRMLFLLASMALSVAAAPVAVPSADSLSADPILARAHSGIEARAAIEATANGDAIEQRFVVPNDKRYVVPNDKRYVVPNDKRYVVPNDKRYVVPNDKRGVMVSNGE